jgi:glutamate synthase (NADPH/NADH) small chain
MNDQPENVPAKRQVNLSKEKTPMKELDIHLRVKNFDEVELGYTLEEAQEEARRCLRCPKQPCSFACPIQNDIPQFIQAVEEGDLEKAYLIITNKSSLPGVCSRVCPQESQCEGSCTRGRNGEPVNIGALERFVVDNVASDVSLKNSAKPATGATSKSVAVVGSGPSGLVCAQELAQAGVDVTVFEALDFLGGVMKYGIPRYRLPKEIVHAKIDELVDSGVEFKLNTRIGELPEGKCAGPVSQSDANKEQDSIMIQELLDKFDAVYLANGADVWKDSRLPGQDSQGVIRANQLLHLVNCSPDADPKSSDEIPDKFEINGRKIAVLGGGNVAMDASTAALRMGASEVKVVYRRSEEELPARRDEIDIAKEEGVVFQLLSSPVQILQDKDGKVTGIEVQQVELGEPDESGRRAPICKTGSEYVIDTDVVIIAIGTDNNPSIFAELPDGQVPEQAANIPGRILVDENGLTSNPKIWAGGDNVTGPKTVVSAMVAAKTAAADILTALHG